MGEFEMRVIVPAAGLSTRFPDMKPKYLLYDYKHELMLANAIRPFLNMDMKVSIGILKEHDVKYDASKFIQHEFGDSVDVVVLDVPTKGPADTVFQIIEKLGLYSEPIFIKDCDSFFEHDISEGNYVCVSKISDHEFLKKIASKSFTVANNQGIITDIVEKEVVSDTFCVGGYKFSSALMYKEAFKRLSSEREVFVSDVISVCIGDMNIFNEKKVRDYTDVGTAQDWFEYNDKPVIFCDIDGTIIINQGRVGDNSYTEKPIALEKNLKRLLDLQSKGAQFVFTTSRENEYKSLTRKMLYDLGFKSFDLITGLQNSRRILINDYNESNPFPRAESINIKRNSDNLSDFL
jgi:hypothetical protein